MNSIRLRLVRVRRVLAGRAHGLVLQVPHDAAHVGARAHGVRRRGRPPGRHQQRRGGRGRQGGVRQVPPPPHPHRRTLWQGTF